MKKALILLITAVLLLAFLPSCDQNVKDGVFTQVVQSAESSKYVIKTYMGNIGSNYYFLETKGVFCNGTCILEGNYADAFMLSENKIVLLGDNGNIYEYSIKEEKLSTDPKYTNVVTINGKNDGLLVIKKEDTDGKEKNFLYKYGDDTKTSDPLTKNFDKILFAEDAVLLFKCTSTSSNSENYKNYLCRILWTTNDWKNTTEEDLTSLNALQVVGFEKAGLMNDVYYAPCSNNNYVYRIALNSQKTGYTAQKINNTIYSPREVDSQMPSFCYANSDGNAVVVFRSASYYEEFTENEGFKSYNAKQDGWATYLHTYDLTVVGIEHTTDSETEFILATNKNGLYRFNPTKNQLIGDGQIKF